MLAAGMVNADNLAVDYLDSNLERVEPKPRPAQNVINRNASLVGTLVFQRGLKLPTFATITPAATLGHEPGVTSTCP